MRRFNSAGDYLTYESPALPVICHRPHAATTAARWFTSHFPGHVLYAVKANPSPLIIDTLYQAGIRHFDIASLPEIELLRAYPDAKLFYMHPVKHPEHIRTAYFQHGIRDFALDSFDELEKIVHATDNADDLGLHLRLAVDNSRSRLPLAFKYGVRPSQAPDLLIAARLKAERLGVCFHVGSQAMDPRSYALAIERANRSIRKAGVILDSLDVGGGFPAAYPGIVPPPLEEYMRIIDAAFEDSLTSETCTLYCEPGRALVAEAASLLVNVTLRKEAVLYINDGAYGSSESRMQYGFFGPTCDSIEFMPGPCSVPADMRSGDYIEIGQLGAYGEAMRSNFNGFGCNEQIIVADQPMMSMYGRPQALPTVKQGR